MEISEKEKIRFLEKRVLLLEEENRALLERGMSGRQKHDDKWLERKEEIARRYESGQSDREIADAMGINIRTVFRYKKYCVVK